MHNFTQPVVDSWHSFQNKFGNESDGSGGKVISADWQTYIQTGGLCGQIIGLYLNGWVSEAFGYKKTMLGSQMLMIAFIFIPFFAQNIESILAGNILLGIPWGVFQTLTLAYASDVAPVVLRPYLTAYVNLCWVIGQLLASGVLRGFLDMKGDWSYRIPFALQWVWPPCIIVATLFSPESPWWLVRKGRLEDAKRAILRLTTPQEDLDFNADDQVAMLKLTDDLEREASAGTNYWHCFMRTDLRRTEIASVSYVSQSLCGSVLMGYSVQFYERAGLSSTDSFNLQVAQYAVGFVGVLLSWVWMTKYGRRTIFIGGVLALLILLVVIGGLGFANPDLAGPSWAIGSLLLVYTFVYDMAVGPLCYTIVAEIPSTRLKSKTIVLARNFSNMIAIINNILMPRMLGVNAWNWGAKTGLFWGGFCVLILIWSFFRLPETKDRTYGELDLLFEHKVNARNFAATDVDQFPAHSPAAKE